MVEQVVHAAGDAEEGRQLRDHDENGEADRGLSRRHREHEQREDLADEVAEEMREGDEVDVHREQDQLDRHQDDDDVLAVEKDARHADREQDRRDGKVMSKPDVH